MRILSVPSFQNTYSTYLNKVISYVNWGGDYRKRLETMHKEITPAALDDKWHQIDQSAWSVRDFKDNLHSRIMRPNVYPPQVCLLSVVFCFVLFYFFVVVCFLFVFNNHFNRASL